MKKFLIMLLTGLIFLSCVSQLGRESCESAAQVPLSQLKVPVYDSASVCFLKE